MSGKTIVILLILVVIGVGVGYQFAQPEQGPVANVTPPPLDPPAGSKVLEPGTSPHFIVGAVAGGKPKDRQAAMSYAIGAYLPPLGWGGDVTRVRQRNGVTKMSLMVVNQAGTFGNVLLMVEAPGETREILEGDFATVRGRIKDIRLAGDPLVGAHQVEIELARVTEITKRAR